ncbi:probable peptide ABC transporter permease protein y4tP [Treponema primitia ZAS-2]|uniref:Probable peptide ABC transporter permease protein y4tP n=1 Tax=Treponema primitia (strain ATCC BAA-887 / DSM 12427 / ZAS-2) TaxID=545694 RepID=F5YQR5_TREPZ|nr:ABC transporter permease [Treponema primitia]AEF85934.1 probable peptide ABC transporter permease protein y4tP [Treponema primitia ZAS-2]
MAQYILRRIAQTFLVLIGITLITFILLNVVPGDPVALMLEKRADAESMAKVRHELGLDVPLHLQYFNFIKNAIRMDFGKSYFTHKNVTEVLLKSFGITLRLAGTSFFFAVLLGISGGITAAINRGKKRDSIIMMLSMAGISAPVFWVAIILQIVFGLKLDWFPISGYGTPISFVLPGIALGTRYAASIARITRTSMLDVVKQDYIRTARAKGASKALVLFKHALKNALIPIITMMGTQLGNMLAGSMLVETIFSIPGIGKLMVDSMGSRDIPLIQGTVVYIAAVFVFINLIVDVSYAFIDPRIRIGQGAK